MDINCTTVSIQPVLNPTISEQFDSNLHLGPNQTTRVQKLPSNFWSYQFADGNSSEAVPPDTTSRRFTHVHSKSNVSKFAFTRRSRDNAKSNQEVEKGNEKL
jgi:hypothetical protein